MALYEYAADKASPAAARKFASDIIDQCEKLDKFPLRGAPRNDLRPGVRTLAFRRRVTIAYSVETDSVTIIGIFYRGQDFETLLTED